jgi:hypothetical protein
VARKGASQWREFGLVWQLVVRAITPPLSFAQMFANWPRISARLAEAPRARMLQIQKWGKTS